MNEVLEEQRKKIKGAFDEFMRIVEAANKEHADTVGVIMRDINDMRIKEIREKLGLK